MRAKTINESKLDSIEVEEVLTDALWDEILSMYDSEDIMKSEENQYRLKEEIEDNYFGLINRLEDIIENDKITIYRKITVADDWLSKLENDNRSIGIYWAYEQDAAEAHWGYDQTGLKEITLESSVSVESVEWIETLQQNINPFYEEEKEIRLIKDSPVKLNAIYDKEGNKIPLPPEIKNKTFKA
jgi:hypothetical protein